MEEKERLLAVDEEEEGIVEDEETDLKNPKTIFRELICVDETSKVFMLLRYKNPANRLVIL